MLSQLSFRIMRGAACVIGSFVELDAEPRGAAAHADDRRVLADCLPQMSEWDKLVV